MYVWDQRSAEDVPNHKQLLLSLPQMSLQIGIKSSDGLEKDLAELNLSQLACISKAICELALSQNIFYE